MIAAAASLLEASASPSDLPFESGRQAASHCTKGVPMLNRRYISVIVIGVLLILPFLLSAQSATPQSNAEVTVYVTASGKRYHTATCRYVRKGATPMKLKDAVKEGYSPCSVCKPPTLEKQPQGSAPRG